MSQHNAQMEVLGQRRCDPRQSQIDAVDDNSLVTLRLVYDSDGRIRFADARHLPDVGAHAHDTWYCMRLGRDADQHRN